MNKFVKYGSAIVALTAMFAQAVPVKAQGAEPKLSFIKSDATISWSTDAGSSPGGDESNENRQSIKIDAKEGGGASAYTAAADEELVGIRGKKLSQITHLGFDSKGTLSAGAPRISLGTTGPDGDHTFFLSAFHCRTADDSNGWRTSDFVDSAQSPGVSPGCKVYDQSGKEYAGLTAAAAAYPNDEVVFTPNDWFVVQDEGPAKVYVDRLSVQNWCWTGNGEKGIVNANSGDCI